MLAVLRFYRLPHQYVAGEARQGLMASGIAPPRPQLAPTFYFKDEPMVDSTPIIARLEAEGVGARSLVPPSRAMAFLSRLIEDFGDEWVTKMMYHYRWDLDTDQEKASQFLMLSSNPSLPPDVLQERSKRIRERQTGRMDFVGSNAVTKPVIEADFRRLVELIDRLGYPALHRRPLRQPNQNTWRCNSNQQARWLVKQLRVQCTHVRDDQRQAGAVLRHHCRPESGE